MISTQYQSHTKRVLYSETPLSEAPCLRTNIEDQEMRYHHSESSTHNCIDIEYRIYSFKHYFDIRQTGEDMVALLRLPIVRDMGSY